MKKNFKHKLTAILAVVLCMSFMLAACGDSNTSTNTDASADTSASTDVLSDSADTSTDLETMTVSEWLTSLTEPVVLYCTNNNGGTSIAKCAVIYPDGKCYYIDSYSLETEVTCTQVNNGYTFTLFDDVHIKTVDDLGTVDDEDVIAFVKDGLEDKPYPIQLEFCDDYVYHITRECLLSKVANGGVFAYYTVGKVNKNIDSEDYYTKYYTYHVEDLLEILDWNYNAKSTHETINGVSFTKLSKWYFKDTDETSDKTIVPDTEEVLLRDTAPEVSDFEVVTDLIHLGEDTDTVKEVLEQRKEYMKANETATEQTTEVDAKDLW